MVNISKPISAGQVQQYYRADFANAKENYYTEGATVRGEWHGALAARWGLHGEVDEQQFKRLSEGQHPVTGEQLVRHQKSVEYVNARGETVRTMEHRAGWDATFSAPKSVSLTALVGGDERVREAHRESVRVALGELEQYTQARIGGNAPAETTGAWAAVLFEHDSARPVNGYSGPHLHSHVFISNQAEGKDGTPRALQPRELYKAQQYATAVYRSELAAQLQTLGYEIERGEYGQPEIKGYTREYLQASSPRRQQIVEHMEERGFSSVSAARVAAHDSRSAKQNLPREEVLARHQQMAAEHGNQPQRVVAEAAQRVGVELQPEQAQQTAREAITHARACSMERTAVEDERALMRDALKHSMGKARLPEVRAEFERQVQAQNLIEVKRNPGAAGRAFVTPEMLACEREIIERMRAGQDNREVLVPGESRQWAAERHPHLSAAQKTAVDAVLMSHDQMTCLEGLAGTGKTTSLAAIREAVAHAGYDVQGLAPTSRAAQKLSDAGMKTETLQMHLTRGDRRDNGQKRLYIVDESSMITNTMMHTFIERLKENERVLFVGDVRQHQGVGAGCPYQALQENGMRAACLEEIIRQQDPALKKAVEQLAGGQVKEAVASLNNLGRVHEIEDRDERIAQIAGEYARQPEKTLVISPDNQSRREINACVHRAMQDAGHVEAEEHPVRVLNARQDLAGADRLYAQNYEPGDILRYAKSSKVHGIEAGEYAQVAHVDGETNTLTVTRKSGEELSYDPHSLQGVTVYREAELNFSEGDRVQMTAKYHAQDLPNRALGTILQIDDEGNLKLRMDPLRKTDPGCEVEFNACQHPHLDYGYAMTSHSSQSQGVGRVLIHVDSEQGLGQLHNKRMAYVSVSRAEFDVQIYTDDAASLGHELSRDVSQQSALGQTPVDQAIGPQPVGMDEIMPDFSLDTGTDIGIGH
jgi:conjugative relaxase-like TrwC/TraI family protein